jgi:hypothetical protein
MTDIHILLLTGIPSAIRLCRSIIAVPRSIGRLALSQAMLRKQSLIKVISTQTSSLCRPHLVKQCDTRIIVASTYTRGDNVMPFPSSNLVHEVICFQHNCSYAQRSRVRKPPGPSYINRTTSYLGKKASLKSNGYCTCKL